MPTFQLVATTIGAQLFLFGIFLGAMITLYVFQVRNARQDMRDMERRLDKRFDQVEADVKILINDVGELKGATGVATASREHEPVGASHRHQQMI